MSGRYEYPPLIYMIAHIKAESLPNLTGDQKALLGQKMMERGYIPIESEAKEFGFKFEFDKAKDKVIDNDAILLDHKKSVRDGFFNKNRSEAIIINKPEELIEYRTTAYRKFSNVSNVFQVAIQDMCDVVPSFRNVVLKEVALTYVDIIVPRKASRTLEDYFDGGAGILPVNILGMSEAESDFQNFGSIQATRIVKSDTKTVISLEQLPLLEGKPTKVLPNRLNEPDDKFTMPITMNLIDDLKDVKHYAMLTTESSMLVKKDLGSFEFRDATSSLKRLTGLTFKGLINEDVCREDWGYVEDEQGGEK